MGDRPRLKRLGGRRSFIAPHSWSFSAPDEATLVGLLMALRDAGVGFHGADPKSWSPSDEFIAFRERGLVSGNFLEVGAAGVTRER